MDLKAQRILVTGACGTIGRELCRQLLEKYQVEELVALDNNESALFFLKEAFSKHPQAAFFLADVRDRDKLSRRMKGIDVVFHTAAFKHITFCERSPFEAVQTNILGVQNVIYAAIENGVKRVIFNQFTETFSVTELAQKVTAAGNKLGLNVKTQHIENPRIEAEEHYDNPAHTGLTNLGLKPDFLDDKTLTDMMNFAMRQKENIILDQFCRNIRWA